MHIVSDLLALLPPVIVFRLVFWSFSNIQTNDSAGLSYNYVFVLWPVTVACYILNHSCGKMKRYGRVIFCLCFIWRSTVVLCIRGCICSIVLPMIDCQKSLLMSVTSW